MDGSDNQPKSSTIPLWQHDSQEKPKTKQDASDIVDVARRWLVDDSVRTSTREEKIAFLESKGLASDQIQELLGIATQKSTEASTEVKGDQTSTLETDVRPAPTEYPDNSRPPVVTYPEFLTKPQRQPPLVTTSGLLATLYAFVGLSTTLYGVSNFVVNPMIDSLTSARTELYATASSRIAELITKLEENISEIPASKIAAALGAESADDASDAEDPTELFHRDIGTQTAFNTNISSSEPPKISSEPPSVVQATSLTTLNQRLAGLRDDFMTQSEDHHNMKTLVDVFRDDLDTLTYGKNTDITSGYDMLSRSRRTEPEDEIRKVRDNIRRIKGVLLSTRSFPTSSR